jgi:hypothetical protein
MELSPADKQAKLTKLLQIEGYENLEELLEAVFSDAVSPAICVNADCNYTCEMEPDQAAGHCEECHTQTMVAAPVLAGVI